MFFSRWDANSNNNLVCLSVIGIGIVDYDKLTDGPTNRRT